MTSRTVIKGGLVIDGTGSPRRPGDVVIEENMIVAVGLSGDEHSDATVIEAGGQVIAPGFIDLHTHADYSVLAFASADSALRQGITTIAVGNCGGGVAPIADQHDIRPVSFAYRAEWGVEPTWRSFPEYLEKLDGLGVNVAAMVPHGALRNAVMGVVQRPATPAELSEMVGMLDAAMQAGAVGISTGLQYRPGCWAPESEIRRLVEVVGSYEGIYASHIRDRSNNYSAAIAEAMTAATGTGAHLQLSHVAARPNAPRVEIDAAMSLMTHPTTDRFGVDTFPEPWGPGLLVDLLPPELMEGDTTDVLARLSNPASRSEMEAYVDAKASFLAQVAGYSDIYLSWVPDRPDLLGFSLGAADTVGAFCCDILLEAGTKLREVGIRHIYADSPIIDSILALPFCTIASDGIVTSGEDEDCPLLWSASSYGFTARLLEHYVRERNSLSLEEAVEKLTSLPAAALGLGDRGVIAPGKKADLVLFDPDTIHDRSTPTLMARHPTGIHTVIVNGIVAADGDGLTGTKAGRHVA